MASNPNLTRYKLKKPGGMRVVFATGTFRLENLTDDQADVLWALGQAQQYLEKIEPAPARRKYKKKIY